MSRFTGPQHPGAMRAYRARKRAEAEARQAASSPRVLTDVRLVDVGVVAAPLPALAFTERPRGAAVHRSADSHERYVEGRCGCGKRAHITRSSAEEHQRRLRQSGDKGSRPYRCPEGNGLWHVGHLPDAVIRGDVTATEHYGRD